MIESIGKYKTALISFCLAILLLVSAVGCSEQDKTENIDDENNNLMGDARQDIDLTKVLAEESIYMQNVSFYIDEGAHNIIETDSGYFILKGSDLHFLDK